ncbi:MAG: fused MFS/spermidine synthase [Planctomycetota bacterium]
MPSALTHAIAIAAGAFLLFLVQPLMGKFLLPWFGGSPEVWSACLFFFQTLLLAGYAYAHLSVRYLRPRSQVVLHVVLLVAALLALPILPNPRWEPTDSALPVARILVLLTATVGLPYVLLASTSPLLQAWYARLTGGAGPYGLYALSNAASLLALASYPLLVEPWLTRQQQAHAWSAAWVVFAALSVACAFQTWRRGPGAVAAVPRNNPGGDESRPAGRRPTGPPRRAALGTRLLWLALPAGATTVLLAATNVICLDLAAVPFLWMLPLGLYLLSFILCFAGERWYARRPCVVVFLIGVFAVIALGARSEPVGVRVQIVVHLVTLFACCMVCHGELYRLRPPAAGLTAYYLTIAAGGALGGFGVTVLAPLLLRSYVELQLGLLACCLFALLADPSPALRPRRGSYAALIALVGVVTLVLERAAGESAARGVLARTRNFYGVLALIERDRDDPALHRYVLRHGTTVHGSQFAAPARQHVPTAYYSEESGVGLALAGLENRPTRRIGVVGLGVGTLATYGRASDRFRFYEINPAVTAMARAHFTFLRDTAAQAEVVEGDARRVLQREPPQEYDLLVLDAFASDAVPVHLLTREAFTIFLQHVRPDGILAAHVSTRHLDLESVVLRLADDLGLHAVLVISPGDETRGALSASWVLLARDAAVLDTPRLREAVTAPRRDFRRVAVWTDDRVNLVQVLK